MKPQLKVPALMSILALSGVISLLSIAPVRAYDEYCVVDRRNEIHCGRLATRDEILRHGNGRRNRRRHRRDDDYYNNNNRRRNRQVEDNLDRLYRRVLGRRIDRNGLRTYRDRILDDGWSWDRVRRDLANSQEARDRINDIYREILGRNADSDGLRHFTRRLERGASLNDIRRDIARSDEARRRRR